MTLPQKFTVMPILRSCLITFCSAVFGKFQKALAIAKKIIPIFHVLFAVKNNKGITFLFFTLFYVKVYQFFQCIAKSMKDLNLFEFLLPSLLIFDKNAFTFIYF